MDNHLEQVKQKQKEMEQRTLVSDWQVEDWETLQQQGLQKNEKIVEQANILDEAQFMKADMNVLEKDVKKSGVKTAPMREMTVVTQEEYQLMNAAAKSKYKKDMKRWKKQLEAERKKELAERKRAEKRAKEAQKQQQRQKEAAEQRLQQDRMDYLMQHPVCSSMIRQFSEAKKKDAKKAIGEMLMQTMAKVLLESEEYGPDFAKQYAEDDYEGLAYSYQMAIAEQGTEADQELLKGFEQQQKRFRRVQEEVVLNKVIRNVIAPSLPAALKKNSILRDCAAAINKKADESFHRERENWREMKKTFPKGLPASDYKDPKVLEKFRAQVKEKTDRGIPLRKAEEEVLKERRQSLRVNAEKMTKAESLIQVKSNEEIAELNKKGVLYSGVSEEQWKKDGGCTWKKIMPTAEAEKLVAKSNGFLCAVKVKTAPGVTSPEGLREIRPSLPETISVKGENVPLRKAYNLLIKTYITMMTNPDGSLKSGDKYLELVEQFKDLTFMLPMKKGDKDWIKKGSEILNGTFRPVMQKLLEEQYEKEGKQEEKKNAGEETAKICDGLMLVLSNMQTSFIHNEISLASSIDSSETLMHLDVDKLADHLRSIKLKVREIGKDGKETLVEKTPTEEEIAEAIQDTFADLEKANEGLKQVRNLDLNGPEIPISNACSANGSFYAGMRTLTTGKPLQIARYLAENYVLERPADVCRYLLNNLDMLAQASDTKPKVLEMHRKELIKLSSSFSPGDSFKTTNDSPEIRNLWAVAKDFSKYLYHIAADIIDDEENGLVTIEGFAAETSQYMVESFTMHSAIGQYHGKTNINQGRNEKQLTNTSFSKYYNADNPFASGTNDSLKIYIKMLLNKKGEEFQKK